MSDVFHAGGAFCERRPATKPNGIRYDNLPENLEVTTRGEHAREHGAHPEARDDLGRFKPGRRHDPAEWPEDLRVREFPEVRT